MPQYFLIRLIAFATALLLPAIAPAPIQGKNILLLPMLLTHYLLAVPYSKRQLTLVFQRRHTALKLAGLVALAALLYQLRLPDTLYYLFAFHYVFSEVYLLHDRLFKEMRPQTRAIRVSSIFFNLTAYFIAIGLDKFSESVQIAMVAAYLVTGLAWATSLIKSRNLLTSRQLINSCLFETFALAIVCVGVFIAPIPLASFIFYHVLFWFLYPSLKMLEARQFKPLFNYVGQNALLITFFVLLAPELKMPFHLSLQQYMFLFYFGSVFHILTTLSMSNAQPAWLTAFFNPGLLRQPSPSTRQPQPKTLALSNT